MKLLALESADQACSVAIWQQGELLQRVELAPRQQTLKMLPWVKELLAEAGLSLTQLDAIAFGHGPGGFTGLRVATSVAQGLAFSANLPVVGISTLAALAYVIGKHKPQASYLLPVLDARMHEVYLGAYQRDQEGFVTPLAADQVCSPDALPLLPEHAWWAGGGGLVYEEKLAKSYRLAGGELALYPQAASVATLASRAVSRGEGGLAEDARPVYLRNKVVRGAIR